MLKLIEKDNFFEMANARPNKTGLKMVIWIFPKTGKEKHECPRIKVQNVYGDKCSNNWFSVSIDKENPEVLVGSTDKLNQKDLNKVFLFVRLNYETLMRLWRDEIDSHDCISAFNKV